MPPTTTRRALFGALTLALLATACGASGDAAGGSGATSTASTKLDVQPQNSTLLVGENRLGIALTQGGKPVLDAIATVAVQSGGRTLETEKLEFAGHEYHDIPYYLSAVSFPGSGAYHLVVDATLSNGVPAGGAVDVQVTTKSPEPPVG